ncbi:hypothetical protein LCG56_28885 (plasmid) [Pseudomonas cannabina pv. alisalensis]|uniref:Uncharacterized protein n=1 Tax=Pseudomonas syringae pv. maculicola str. ES4326 TaxID=629265 RepID=A0A8T8CA16_PSEYM|nr:MULTISPECIES: hypothetical protein [Pseudomonas syringae group]QHF00410.1 hypothetical protein PMA4326_028230 [Pseudomonas syringae pv. maculicola str. ES4326]UBZ00386.1 hypothetical protein LCG56_28885 [Pseudomonas cannabina pv. alisalensis]
MNAAFREALAARFLWTDYLVLEAVGESEAQIDAAYQASFDAVAELASNDVLSHRHYGPVAPRLLQDVPLLEDHYNLAYEVYSEIYYKTYHDGSIEEMQSHWLPPAKPMDFPYSQWVAAVNRGIADLMGKTCSEAAVATISFDEDFFPPWRNKELPTVAAHNVYASYQRHIAGLDEIDLDEFMQKVARDLEEVRQHEDHYLRCACTDHS